MRSNCSGIIAFGVSVILLGGCHVSTAHTLDHYLLTRPWVVNAPAVLVVAPVRTSKRKLVTGKLHVLLPVGWRVLSRKKWTSGAVRWTLGVPPIAAGRPPASKNSPPTRVYVFAFDHPPSSMRPYAHDLASVYIRREYRNLGDVSRFFSKYRSPWDFFMAVYGTDPRLVRCATGAARARMRCLLWLRATLLSQVRFSWEGPRLRAVIKVFPRPVPWHYFVDAVLFDDKGQDCGYVALQSRSLRKRQAVFAVAELLSSATLVRDASPIARKGDIHHFNGKARK